MEHNIQQTSKYNTIRYRWACVSIRYSCLSIYISCWCILGWPFNAVVRQCCFYGIFCVYLPWMMHFGTFFMLTWNSCNDSSKKHEAFWFTIDVICMSVYSLERGLTSNLNALIWMNIISWFMIAFSCDDNLWEKNDMEFM